MKKHTEETSSAPFRRRLATFLAVAATALTASACGTSGASSPSGTNGSAATPSPVTVRLGYLTNLTNASALVGVADGTFVKNLPANVTLETSTYNAGPAEVTAMLAGSLDVAFMGPNSAITAYTQGQKSIRIISGATSGGAALVVAPSITSPKQLQGKTIATPQLGNTQDVALRTWLTKQHLTFPGPEGGGGDVTILPEDNATTLASLTSGAISGAWVPEPWATRLVAEGGGHILVNEASQWPNGRFATTLLVVTTDFLNAHPTVVTDLLKGQIATTKELNTSPVKAQATANAQLLAVTGKALKGSVLSTAWTDMVFTNDPIATSIVADVSHAKAAGFPTTNISGIFDLAPLNSVLASQGQARVGGA